MKQGGLFDSRTDGFLPMQDFRKPGLGGVARPEDQRAGLYGVRISARTLPLGQMVHRPETIGDVFGSHLWEAFTDTARQLSAWRYITPCVCDDGEDRDAIEGPTAYTPPGGEVDEDSRQPSGPVTRGMFTWLDIPTIPGAGGRPNDAMIPGGRN